MPDPRDMITTLLKNNASITADDGTTTLTDANGRLIIRKHPFAQEGVIGNPHIMVGPQISSIMRIIQLGARRRRITTRIEIRAIARDMDYADEGYSLTGPTTRSKLQDEIRRVIRINQLDPDGTGTYQILTIVDLGRDTDSVIGEGIPIYRTALLVETWWYESF